MSVVDPLPPQSLLDVAGLRVQTAAGQVLAEDISFRVEPGRILGLVGESGSGKSMIANAVMGLLPPGISATGQITLAGQSLLDLPPPRAREVQNAHLGYVFQNPRASLNPRLTVGAQLREALAPALRRDGPAALRRVLELLDEVGIARAQSRLTAWPHELSGGLAQRVVIAMALARDPQVLIADEPTTALDMTIQAQILNLIAAIQAHRHFGVLLITHDMGVIHDRADAVTVLARGRIVEAGPKVRLFRAPRAAETRALIEGALIDEALPPLRDAAAGLPAYSVQGLSRRFPGPGPRQAGVQALEDVSLQIGAGRSLGIVGESGSGKTTLARILLRLERGDSGAVSFRGEDLARLKGEALRRWRRSVQFVFQDHWASLNPHHSILDSIAEPLRAEGMPRAERQQRALEVMRDVALPEVLAHRRPAQLSGGQLQRAAIARALALRPEILIADEPVASLDVTVQARILRLLERLRDEFGLSYIIISHDLRVVKRLTDEVIVMKEGRIVERGATRQIFTAPQHGYTRQLLAATPGRVPLAGDAVPTAAELA